MAGGKSSFGVELWLAPAGGTLVKLANIRMVSPPEITRGVIDDTNQDSPGGAEEVIYEGIFSVGEIECEGNFIESSTDDTAIMGYITAGTKLDIRVGKIPGVTVFRKQSCSGFITKYKPNIGGPKDKMTFSMTIKPTGAITKSTDP